MGDLPLNEQYGDRYPDLASKATDGHADRFSCWPTPRSDVARYVLFQPLTVLLEFCESNREKCLGKPEPEDDTDNNASEKNTAPKARAHQPHDQCKINIIK